MKIVWKKMGQRVLWLISIVLIAILFVAASKKSEHQKLQQVDIRIDQQQGNFFINEKDIQELVFNENDLLIGKSLDSLSLKRIERKIERLLFVRKAEVYSDQLGSVKVLVEQRIPIVRVINSTGVSFYLDEKGSFMSTSDKFTAHVPVVTGHVPITPTGDERADESEILTEVFNLSVFIHEHEFWRSQVEQIYRTKKGEYFIIPKVGNHEIKFGTAEGIKHKFDKLMGFYKDGLNYVGWNEYKTIDITIDGQVVCTKK